MATSFKEFTYTFGANENILINSVGSVIRCTRGTNNFEIQPQAINESFSKIPFENGLSVTYEYDFDKIEISNGASGQTIQLYVGDGTIDDSRLTGAVDITGGITTKASSDSTLAMTQADVTAVAASLIASAASGNRVVSVTPIDGDIYLGDSAAVATTDGFKIAQGGSIVLSSNDEVFAIAGADVDCRIMIETYN